MNRPLSILSVGTHPKDAIIYCGGTLAKHAARSDKVCCLAVTHGARWTHWRAIDEMAESGEPPDIGALI
jgi:LmbE family N-acetylglucosaminyl deacetylase